MMAWKLSRTHNGAALVLRSSEWGSPAKGRGERISVASVRCKQTLGECAFAPVVLP